MNSPVITMYLANPTPTILERRLTPKPGTNPSRASGTAKRALDEAITMSQELANSQPPPAAMPFTAAITGFVQVSTASNVRMQSTMKSRRLSVVVSCL